jgi:hypothetical protein
MVDNEKQYEKQIKEIMDRLSVPRIIAIEILERDAMEYMGDDKYEVSKRKKKKAVKAKRKVV